MNQDDIKKIEDSLVPEVNSWTSMDLYYKGFHIKKSFPENISDKDLIETIESLIEKGFKPSWNDETTQKALAPQTPAIKDYTAPQVDLSIDGESGQGGKCPVHGTPLVWKAGTSKTTGNPYAFWSCPTKNADGSYCSAGTKRK